jgi:hypothetical protein
MTTQQVENPNPYQEFHELHNSERSSFRECRRQWNWHFRENYNPLITAPYFEFGEAYHKAMEVYYAPETWSQPRDVIIVEAIQAFVDMCEEQRQAAIDKGAWQDDSDVQVEYDGRVAVGKEMLAYYFSDVAPEHDNFTPVEVEKQYRMPVYVPGSHGEEVLKCPGNCGQNHPEGAEVVYVIRVDLLVKDQWGNLWILDWKTAGQLMYDESYLYLDNQISSYVLVLRLNDIPVKGFIYHEQRKDAPEPPKRLTRQNGGRWYSVAKNQGTDYKTFITTVIAEDTAAYNAGLYEDFLAHLEEAGPKYFNRFQIIKTDRELRNIAISLFHEASDMLHNPAIYPNPTRFKCGRCAFRQPCMGVNQDEDYLFTLNSLFEKGPAYYHENGAAGL